MTAVVIDAGAALDLLAASEAVPATPLELHAPHLLRSEVLSALHALVWRGVVPRDAAVVMLRRLDELAINLFADERLLHERAWSIADDLGWAKTYDAAYVAVAHILDIPLLTTDGRLARRAGHLVRIIGPADLGP